MKIPTILYFSIGFFVKVMTFANTLLFIGLFVPFFDSIAIKSGGYNYFILVIAESVFLVFVFLKLTYIIWDYKVFETQEN